MGFIRTDEQVALNNLLVAIRESIDHYHDAAGILEEKTIRTLMGAISQERKSLATRLEQAIRDSGDLPTVPDADKKTGEMLVHHVAAFLKDGYTDSLLQQRLVAEQNLLDLIADGAATGLGSSHTELLNDLAAQVEHARAQLQKAYESVARVAQ